MLQTEGTFTGRDDFRQIVRDALATAASEGWQHITLCDATFDDWPLGERVVIESLNAWSKTGRTCTLLAKRFDTVVIKHPRFVSWRGRWSHIIEARGVPSADAQDFPSAIHSPGWVMQRLDLVHGTGICSTNPQRRLVLGELLREWQGKSSPAFAATTLGL